MCFCNFQGLDKYEDIVHIYIFKQVFTSKTNPFFEFILLVTKSKGQCYDGFNINT